jgi:hypothetical protein
MITERQFTMDGFIQESIPTDETRVYGIGFSIQFLSINMKRMESADAGKEIADDLKKRGGQRKGMGAQLHHSLVSAI